MDNLTAWSEETAGQLAAEKDITLTQPHIEILKLARQFYAEYGFSPSMRPLIKTIGINLGVSKARSIYLMQLFPQSPAKIVARLSGLPKPKNCL